MIKVTAQRGEIEAYVMELVADTPSDVSNLNANYGLDACAPGSTCLIIGNSSVWMLGNDGVWHEL